MTYKTNMACKAWSAGLFLSTSLLTFCLPGVAQAQVTTTPLPSANEPATAPDAASRQEATQPSTGSQGGGATPSAAAPAADTGIADIVVTAQRRSENLQNVPIAITAVTAASLQARGVSSTQDLIAAVPSLTTFTTAGYLQPRLRGIGNNVIGAGYEGGVALYVDGVYYANPLANVFSLANVDRVEVLKGPQGTLFGRNTTGGLIQIVTIEPSQDFGGRASFTAANYKDFTEDLYLTGGLAPGLAMNFAGHLETQGDGWGKNLYNGKDAYRVFHDLNLYSSLLYRSGHGTDIRITADYQDNRNNVTGSTGLAPGTGFPLPGVVPPKPWDINNDVQPLATVQAGGISLKATQDLGFASLVNITAYRRSSSSYLFDGDLTQVPLLGIMILQNDHQFSEELQLASKPKSKLKWVAGIYYFNSVGAYHPVTVDFLGGFTQPQTPIGPIDSVSTSDKLGTRSYAIYAQGTYPILEDLNLTLGGRYTKERKNLYDIETSTKFALLPEALPGGDIPSQTVRYNRPTWRAALDRRFSPELLVYASYNRGFKSGGFNGQSPADAAFSPEKIDAYEVGAKTDLLDHHVRVNISGFYYNYTNIQVLRYVNSLASYYNGASAHVYGLDADFEARITPALTFSGGITALHDRFASFPDAVIATQVPNGVINSTGSAKGNRLPLAPDFSGTFALAYQRAISIGELSLDISDNYNVGYFVTPDNTLRQPSYNLLTAGAGIAFSKALSVRIWGRNLLNDHVFSTLSTGTFDNQSSYQAPRTYGITVGAKF